MSSIIPEEILDFLRESVGEQWEVKPLRGDASTRGYFRLSTPEGRSYMLAYYPEQSRQDVQRFLRAHKAIALSARVPAVHYYGSAAVLQEDVGDETLFEILRRDHERGIRLYRAAIDLLISFQDSPPSARELNPAFDVSKFGEELEMSRQYYVEELSNERSAAIHQQVRRLFGALAQRLTEHPYVLCHRDYHGQNIHVRNDVLYMIDYQDMRMGPDTYDLASLLHDRGIARLLGRDTEEALLEYYRGQVRGDPDMRRRYLETLLQRSIKVLGTFAYQTVVRNRKHYLEFIPPAVESVQFCLAALPEYAELGRVFR
jgi:aminoglycoside/choline kinase family phosphotransferase